MKKIFFILFALNIYQCAISQNPQDIFTASRRGNLNGVKEFIDKGTDINIKSPDGYNLLHCAVSGYGIHNIELISYLIDKGVDINALTNQKLSALGLLTEYVKDTIAFAFLIKKGINMDTCVQKKLPLYNIISTYAIGNKIKFAKILVENGYPIEKKCNNNESPLQYALAWNCPDIAWLLIKKGVKIDSNCLAIDMSQNSFSNEFNPPGYIDKIKDSIRLYLINNEIGINVSGGRYKTSPISYSINSNNKKIFNLLLTKKVKTEICDENGWTPLHEAAYKNPMNNIGDTNQFYYVKMLVEYGANLNSISTGERFYSGFGVGSVTIPEGSTPLDVAIISKASKKIIDFLIINGAIRKIPDNY